MNRILLLLMLFLLHAASFSQELRIDQKGIAAGSIGSVITSTITIQNPGKTSKILGIRKISDDLSIGQESSICWNGACVTDNGTIPFRIEIPAGAANVEIQSLLQAGLTARTNQVKYVFYDIDNPTDVVIVPVQFEVEEPIKEDMVFNNDRISVKRVFPNPVNQDAFIEYELFDTETKAKVVIHNILGTNIKEYKLPPIENRLRLDLHNLSDGIYFYTLYLDNHSILTNKLIVKKY